MSAAARSVRAALNAALAGQRAVGAVRVVAARRPWSCSACGEPIGVGAIYSQWGSVGSRQQRRCVACSTEPACRYTGPPLTAETAAVLVELVRRGEATSRQLGNVSPRLNVLMARGLADLDLITQVWRPTELGRAHARELAGVAEAPAAVEADAAVAP